MVYESSDEVVDLHNWNNRARKILWFTPSYNMAVANKIGKEFFRLLRKTFLHRIVYTKYLIGTPLN